MTLMYKLGDLSPWDLCFDRSEMHMNEIPHTDRSAEKDRAFGGTFGANTLNSMATLQPDEVNYDIRQFDALHPGYRLGEHRNYRLVQHIATGGMGQTWLAEQIEGGEVVRQVVCKILSDRLRGNDSAMTEVRRVFHLTKMLSHPNICPIHGMFHDPDFGWFLVMAYAEAGTLRDWFLAQPGYERGIPVNYVQAILCPIAQALDLAHSRGIIHRDVKPSNIMFTYQNGTPVPWLIDFGIASRIHMVSGTIPHPEFCRLGSGTPHYMAPEQFLSRPQDKSADQYALASTAYELLSGSLPFQGENPVALGVLKSTGRPSVVEWLDARTNRALQRALSPEPSERFDSCVEFIEALTQGTEPLLSLSFSQEFLSRMEKEEEERKKKRSEEAWKILEPNSQQESVFSGKNLRKNRGNLKEIEKESAGCSFGCLLFCLFMLLWGSCEQQKRFTYLPDAEGALVSESVQEMPKIPKVLCLK
ncbi:MAG: serine/threonine protein kinase [Planctomycetaceae bacterium]|nr:serine/threonine protein kinase [Planctomycetaceae bacterium]